MKPAYIPKTLGGRLNWIAEECAEIGQAIAKTQRFREEKKGTLSQALHYFDPTVPDDLRETNHAWILRELADLKQAIAIFEASPIPCCEEDPNCSHQPHETFTCFLCKRLRCYCSLGDHKVLERFTCVDCSPKKKPHAKKQSQQTQPQSPKKVRSKKARLTARRRVREHRADHEKWHRH